MSWGRGVANNTAGALRMPSVAQFAEQREQKATLVTASSAVLKVCRSIVLYREAK